MKTSERIAEARRSYDIRHILGMRGRKKIVCPLPMHSHSNNTPSFSVFWKKGVQFFKCHGNCGAFGDVVDLVGYLKIPGYNRRDHVVVALDLMTERIAVSPPFTQVKEPSLDPLLWRKLMPSGSRIVDYAKSRGLKEKTLEKFRVGQFKRFMAMPVFHENSLIGIKLRNTGKGIRYMSVSGSRLGLFNHDAVAYTDRAVFVVKGEIPCMLLDQMGFLACAPTNGEGALSDHITHVLQFAKAIVIGDNDAPGRALGEKRAAALGASLVFPPEGYKDIDDFILGVSDAGNMLREWIERS